MQNLIKKTKYIISDKVKFYCRYKNEQVIGEIIDIREAKYNWDYKIRYQIYTDLEYTQWVSEEDILEKIKQQGNNIKYAKIVQQLKSLSE